MGGSIDVVTSALDLMSNVSDSEKGTTTSKETGRLKAEREAQEAELKQKEEAERRRRRENVTDARERERRRQLAAANGDESNQTTLLNGGAGLTDDPVVSAPQLKDKFGE